VSEGTLVPPFDPNIYEYTVNISGSILDFTHTATLNHPRATFFKNIINQIPDKKIVNIVVTSENKLSQKIYTITVTRILSSEICGDSLTWELANNVLTIKGTGDMYDFTSYTTPPWYSSRSSITKLVVEEGVTSIGQYAFYSYGNLTSIAFPNSLQSIGYNAFSYCNKLSSVTNLNSKPQSISSSVFAGMALNTMTLYVPVEYAEAYRAAAVWKNFGKINPTGDIEYTISGNTLFIRGKGMMTNYRNEEGARAPWYGSRASITTVEIEEGVKSIGDYAFYGFTNLTSIFIPESSVTGIGTHAFYGCSSLTSITLPKGITNIADYAFHGCGKLEFITFPEDVKRIGAYAFRGCGKLPSISIGVGVTSIADYAFSGCSNLASVIIPHTVTSIGTHAFNSCSRLTTIALPNGLASIADYAFYGCNRLTSVTMPQNGVRIGEGAFYGTGLTSISIPKSVINIENFAFQNSSLTVIINLNPKPQNVNSSVFENLELSELTLYVPAESVKDYQKAGVWKDFGKIAAISSSGISTVAATPAVQVYLDRQALHVNSAISERIYVYSLAGALLGSFDKQVGKASFVIGRAGALTAASTGAPAGLMIVRGSSGWAKKIVIND
jgi:hypothetical protein